MTEYKLNCLVEGDKNVLPIPISREATIEQLTHLIYGKRKTLLFRDIDPADLTLWKVEINLDPHRGHFSEFRLDHNHRILLDDFGVYLSELWEEQPPARHLHVFVKPPSSSRDLIPPPKQSNEDKWLHGWDQLDDNDTWKRFYDYWREQNAETTRSSPSITFAYDERGEEDPKYRLPLVPWTNNKIIVRDCYKDFYDYIVELRNGSSTGLILTGQPGTGKTLWLLYALVRLLNENKAVAYHSVFGTYLFFENSVYLRILGQATAFPPDKATFCLIDSDREKSPADISFMTDGALVHDTFPVMAASPNPSRYDTWRKQRHLVPMEIMPLWNRYELKKGLELQPFYDDLRQDVETVARSQSVDDSSTMAVSPKKLREEDRNNLILSALKMIAHRVISVDDSTGDEDEDEEDNATGDEAMVDATGDEDEDEDDATGDEAMDDATGDEATTGDAADNATVNVDVVLDQILDNAIETYGSSARDVYSAIFSPTFFEGGINDAVKNLDYDILRDIVIRLERAEPVTFSHTIFSMRETEPPGRAHLRKSSGFEVEFKSHSIKSMVLKQLEFLHHIDTTVMIKQMKSLATSASYAGFLYEGFAAKELASGKSFPGLVSMRADKDKTTFAVPTEPNSIVTPSPFNRPRERSYVTLTGPEAFNVSPENSLADYFWIPMAPNNPLFDAFVIEIKDSDRECHAIVWILQMTLSKKHGGSPDGYVLIDLIKTKVEEVMSTMPQTEKRTRRRRKVNNVIVKYVLVSTEGGTCTWTLPKKNWRSNKGDVYYQCVKL